MRWHRRCWTIWLSTPAWLWSPLVRNELASCADKLNLPLLLRLRVRLRHGRHVDLVDHLAILQIDMPLIRLPHLVQRLLLFW